MEIWIWGAIIVVSIIVEFCTAELLSIWFVLGGIAALLFAIFGLPVWSQILVFLCVSAIMLLCTRKIFSKFLKSRTHDTNVNALIGAKAELLEDVTDLIPGSLKLNGIVWTAVVDDGTELKKGNIVIIKSVNGNKLVVEKYE